MRDSEIEYLNDRIDDLEDLMNLIAIQLQMMKIRIENLEGRVDENESPTR